MYPSRYLLSKLDCSKKSIDHFLDISSKLSIWSFDCFSADQLILSARYVYVVLFHVCFDVFMFILMFVYFDVFVYF